MKFFLCAFGCQSSFISAVAASALPATPTHLPTRTPTSPFTQHTTWQYKYGRGSPRLRQPGPALRSVSRPPPIRSRVVTRDVRFTAAGGCSVWFIPVCSCLLRAAGDLTRTHARTHPEGRVSECAHRLFMTGEYCRSTRARAHTHIDAAEGLKPSSAEVAGSRSSAGLTGDMN